MKPYSQREVIAEMVLNPGKVFKVLDALAAGNYCYWKYEGDAFFGRTMNNGSRWMKCLPVQNYSLAEEWRGLKFVVDEEPTITIKLKLSDWEKVKDIVNGVEVK